MFEVGKVYKNKATGYEYVIVSKSISNPDFFVVEKLSWVNGPFYIHKNAYSDYEKEKDKAEKWIAVFKAGHSFTYKKEPVFTDEQKKGIFAIKKIVFEEGEGL